MYFHTITSCIGAIDIAKYSIPNDAENFYIGVTLPVPVPLLYELVRPGLEKHCEPVTNIYEII